MTSEKIKSFSTLGLQIEEGMLKGVYLTQKKGAVFLNDLFTLPLSGGEEENVNPLYMDEKGKKLLQLLKSVLAITAISGSETLVRPLYVKLKKEKDIDAVIEFQAEPLLPFETGEAVVDWLQVGIEEEGSELTIFGVKKEHVLNSLEGWKKYGVDPECVSTVPAAILSFSNYFVSDRPSYFFAHIGSGSTSCGLIYGGKLLSGQYLPVGVDSLIEAYAKDVSLPKEAAAEKMQTLDFTLLERESSPLLSKAIDSLRMELLKTFYGLAKQMKGEEVKQLFMIGEGGALSSLSKRMMVELKMEPIELSIDKGFGLEEPRLKRNAVPIGLALSGLPIGEGLINLRKGELAHPNPLRRLMKPLALYFLACMLLVAGLFLFGRAAIGAKEDRLKEQFGSLLSSMNKPYAEFEKEYEAKAGEHAGEIVPIENLGMTGLLARLDFLEGEIDAAPRPIALMPNTPLVSDVLAWLSTHPNVVLVGDEAGGRTSLIHIENFSYSMVKRPDEKKRDTRYQVKIDLEFSSATPKLAREFHDALIEDNRMVDPNGEVKWSSNRGKYRTSFFLKDRTYYP